MRLQRGSTPQQLRPDSSRPVRRQPPSTAVQQRSTLQPRALSVITGTDSGGRSLDPVLQPPASAPGAGHEDTRRGSCFSGLTCAERAGSLHHRLPDVRQAQASATQPLASPDGTRVSPVPQETRWSQVGANQVEESRSTALSYRCVGTRTSQLASAGRTRTAPNMFKKNM